MIELKNKFVGRGAPFEVLAFPCNQFGGQESKCDEEIQQFAQKKGANFPVFGKVEVNGENADPVYKFLKHWLGGTLSDGIKWNFEVFVCDKNGVPVERFLPSHSPGKVEAAVERLLGEDDAALRARLAEHGVAGAAAA